jgi:Ni,Fe-hydrogenase III small subunit/Pyruvate/2-oxoacid:ferredoxin oxidoreductase delta subunit
MLKLLTYLLSQPVVTAMNLCPPFGQDVRGLPGISSSPCDGAKCKACVQLCPTAAINVLPQATGDAQPAKVSVDLGACIGCGLCFQNCPTGTIVENLSTRNATRRREDLVITNELQSTLRPGPVLASGASRNPFRRSLHARVVSTGCSACDLEIGACANPIFDIERLGVHIVASPRFADALMVTGPVGLGMQSALRSCFEAMPEPRVVVAVGTCAISGGLHKASYTEANGVDAVLPVDVYIPGCAPHPWQIIYGVLLAMGKENILEAQPALIPKEVLKQ